MLERAGQIEWPPVRRHIRGQCRTARPRPEAILIDTTPWALPLPALGPIEIEPARRTVDEPLFNSLMEHPRYLGYEQPVGEHLQYVLWAQGRPIACLAWSSARPFHRLACGSAAAQHPFPRREHALSASALGGGASPGLAHPQPHRAALIPGLGARLGGHPPLFSGDLRRSGTLSWNLLPGG